jgi:hypothetical protein
MSNSPYFPHIFPVFLIQTKKADENQALDECVKFPVFHLHILKAQGSVHLWMYRASKLLFPNGKMSTVKVST